MRSMGRERSKKGRFSKRCVGGGLDRGGNEGCGGR